MPEPDETPTDQVVQRVFRMSVLAAITGVLLLIFGFVQHNFPLRFSGVLLVGGGMFLASFAYLFDRGRHQNQRGRTKKDR